MKKIMTFLLIALMFASLAGCKKSKSYELSIRIPAGSTEKFVYSDEEFNPAKDLIIVSGQDLPDTEVVLIPLAKNDDGEYLPTYITNGMPVEFEVNKDGWYKIGISIQNVSDKELIKKLTVKNIHEIRIPELGEVRLDVEMFVKYHDGRLCFEIVNNTDKMLGIFDASIRLEKMIDQQWSVVPFAEGVGFCGNASSFDENGVYGPISFEMLYDSIDAGEYRLSMVVSDDISLNDTKDTSRVYTTFVVGE